MALQSRVLAAILPLLLGVAGLSIAEQSEHAPSQELVKYINEARRRGVAESKIRKEAVTLGWPAAVIDEALAAVKSGKTNSGAGSEEPSKAPATSPGQSQVVTLAVPAAANPNPGPVTGSVTRRPSDDYVIGAGDTLQVAVWKESEVSVPSVVVRSDGKITVPLIKEVAVAGLAPLQAEKVITEALAKFLPDANVTVVVAAMNSKKIHVIGAVKKEGPIPYTHGMTVIQALSEAGGLTDYARRKKIYILRSEHGREYRLDFNYDEVVRGEQMSQNVMLLAGDTVVVPN
jgi:polysaccharide export outer membrane protein